jgi:hypothetical protein
LKNGKSSISRMIKFLSTEKDEEKWLTRDTRWKTVYKHDFNLFKQKSDWKIIKNIWMM